MHVHVYTPPPHTHTQTPQKNIGHTHGPPKGIYLKCVTEQTHPSNPANVNLTNFTFTQQQIPMSWMRTYNR